MAETQQQMQAGLQSRRYAASRDHLTLIDHTVAVDFAFWRDLRYGVQRFLETRPRLLEELYFVGGRCPAKNFIPVGIPAKPIYYFLVL